VRQTSRSDSGPSEPGDLLSEVSRCVRCARCKEVCPAYRATRDERKLARGRLMVLERMLSGKLAPSAGVREVLEACLKCHRCASICPVGIDTVELFLRGQRRVPRPGLRALLTRLVFRVIVPRRRLYDLFVRSARFFQRLLPRPGAGLRHIPLVFEGSRNVPEIAPDPALRLLPQVSGSGPKVALFLGCLENYVFTRTAENAVEILLKAGFEVIVPKGQACCGLAALYLGDDRAAYALARHNAEAFQRTGAGFVVTACATCATMLKNEYPALLGPEWPAGAQVMEICEFLAAQGYEPPGRGQPVAYHESCHLRYAQGVSEEPRRLLRAAGELREPAEGGRCCGGGGTFSILHYGLSREIGATQAGLLKETGARTVATACPGCMLQLRDILEQGIEVCHVIDYLAEAGRRENEPEGGDFVAAVSSARAS
jgi:glycolate oxidase iron-sulfur subunit